MAGSEYRETGPEITRFSSSVVDKVKASSEWKGKGCFPHDDQNVK